MTATNIDPASLRSNFPDSSVAYLNRRAEWGALGIPVADMKKPKIAIVNSSNDLAACFAHLDDIVPVLKDELRKLGALPFEIRTAVPSDFVTNIGAAGGYILPTRDLITNDIEVVVEGAQLDAMIGLVSCDKTTPGHLMAAGRLNIPTVIIPCGYQHSGRAEHGGSDVEEIFMRASAPENVRLPQEELEAIADDAILGPGVCSGFATANSMHVSAEALGMTVPGAAPVRANSEKMWDTVRRSAAAIMDAIAKDRRPRDIMTADAFHNAAATMLSLGGSINTIKHLQAIAVSCELDIDIWEMYRTLGRQVPMVAAVQPNGQTQIEEFEDAGGGATTLRELLPLLKGEAMTVTGQTVAERAELATAADGKVIRTITDPFATTPAIVVLKGSLATEASVTKRPVPDPGPYVFEGPAKVYHSRDEAVEAVGRGEVVEGDVVVLRGIGLTGAPGMGFTTGLIFALAGAGLAGKVAMVTDGQYSGLANSGIVVGEVSPEAAQGGALGLVNEGDRIRIDLESGSIDLLVDPAELATRPPFQAADRKVTGYLDQYRSTVQSLACGAVLCGGRRDGSCGERSAQAQTAAVADISV
ncbi:dihydroxy-acid dehydratase [Microbacterium sp. BWT-B31]|uniref:dihydroxy-acid dehydratase domain-containing protein n=1 Tax=Microbacterium sp. BWT-B31 TaxID=3232072 RepID=UPI003527C07E